MSFWPFTRKPAKPRTQLTGASVQAILRISITGATSPNYRHIGQKDLMATIRKEDVEAACAKAFMPWSAGAWECEDQARALIHAAQAMAANEGCSWAIGTLRAAAQDGVAALHVYVWAIIGGMAVIYDPTGRRWLAPYKLADVDHSIT